jgi:hypothetical protein
MASWKCKEYSLDFVVTYDSYNDPKWPGNTPWRGQCDGGAENELAQVQQGTRDPPATQKMPESCSDANWDKNLGTKQHGKHTCHTLTGRWACNIPRNAKRVSGLAALSLQLGENLIVVWDITNIKWSGGVPISCNAKLTLGESMTLSLPR